MRSYRLMWLILLLWCDASYAALCSDIWTQAVRINSAVPSTITLPTTLNPSFPEQLDPIDYYYSGNFVSGQNRIANSASPTARLIIDGNLTIESGSRFNNLGQAQNFILVVTGSLTVQSNVIVNGFILAGGAISIASGSTINGAVTAKGSVANNGTVNYQQDQLLLVNGGTVCENALISPLLHYPLDICPTSDGSVLRELIAANNGMGTGLTSAEGVVLNAANFTSSTQAKAEINSSRWNGLTDFSVSFWQRSDNSQNSDLVSVTNNNSNEFRVFASNDGTLGLTIKGQSFTSSLSLNRTQWHHVVITRKANQICVYSNSTLFGCANTSSTAALNALTATLGALVNGSAYSRPFVGQLDEAVLFRHALTAQQVRYIYQNQLAGNNYDSAQRTDECLGCLSDSFNSGLIDSWVTNRSSGSFTPQVVDGRLRMTEAIAYQSTSATYQRLYPAANNLVVVEFDYFAWSPEGGTGADGLAVILSDATITPQPGSFGGSLGYAQRDNGDAGFAGGWLGIALDEYGNFSNPTEGRNGGPGFRPQSVSIRGSAAGGYSYLTGTAANISPPIDVRSSAVAGPGHRYRITVDSRLTGQALVSVQRKTGSNFIEIIAPFNALSLPGQSPVPENFFLSFTGSTGGSNNYHELDNLSICALRSSPVGQQIDHFEFDYSGQALTCKPETFTIRACKNASCSELVTDPVSANLSPANSSNINWAGGNIITFSGGSTTASLARTVSGSTVVGVSGSVPSTRPLSQTLCRAGSGPLNNASCSVNFADSGLVFEVPDGVANRPDSGILLRAVRKDDNSQQCVPGFANVTRNVAFWSDYITPDSSLKPVAWPVTVNNQSAGLTAAAPVIMPLAFNAQGQASLSVNYADAGQLQLNARYSGSAANGDAGLEMTGADQFIRRPLGLCIKTGGECAAGDISCPVFARAGETFNLTISAHAYADGSSDLCQNPLTPSFRQNLLPVSHSLVTPVAGAAGTISNTLYSHQMAVNAQNTLAQSVSEVGVFRFHSAAFNYLGMTDVVPAASSGATGRFVPASFSISPGTVIAACGSFSYFGQADFSTNANIAAHNTTGTVTQNYTGSFARLNLNQWTDSNSGSGMRYSAPSLPAGAELRQGLLAPLGSWINGEAAISASHYASRPDNQLAPVSITVYAQPVDADGVTMSMAQPLHSATTALRFGRLFLHSAAGPEEEAMPLRLTTEYYAGSRFVQNLADNCTVLSAAPALLSTIVGSPALTLQGSGGVVVQGALPGGPLQLTPTGQSGNWIIEYQVPEYLRYNWRDGVTDFSQNPQADIMFGRFRGNPRQIFWRERFQ